MRAIVGLILVLFLMNAPQPSRAQGVDGAEWLTLALDAVRTENWSAADIAARPGGDIVRDIVEWHRLRAAVGEFSDYQTFLARRGDWPGLKLLRRRGEGALRDDVPAAEVFAYFNGASP